MTKEKMRAMRKACRRVHCSGCSAFDDCGDKEIQRFIIDNRLSGYPMFWTDNK